MKFKIIRHACMALVWCGSVTALHAQDTLHITLRDAEQKFLDSNLSLLSQRYNIDVAKAQVIQAKLFPNPSIDLSGNIYNPDRKKWGDISNKTGEYTIGIQQLIQLAGKRNKQIRIAETNTQIAEQQFFDLLRTLRYTLRSDFYQAYFFQSSINAYSVQVTTLEKLATTYDELQKKGIVTLKDAVRIKSLLYSLKAERTSLQNQFNDVEAEMQLLLKNNHTWYIPDADTNIIVKAPIQDLQLQTLLDSAYANRYDLKLTQSNLLLNQQNYQLQKALAVPDLTLGGQFDKRGSFVDNASFLTVGMDLPFFNRNQGNIKAAKISIDQSKVLVQQQTQTVENEVQTAFTKALNTDKMLNSVDPGFRNDFEKLLKSVTDNFAKKNLSILEFTDFYDSYKENILQINQLMNDRMQAIETLNFAVGKPLINQ